MELGKTYDLDTGQLYVHDLQRSITLLYRTKEFILIQQQQTVMLSVSPVSITDRRVLEWLKDKIGFEDRIVTPGGRTLSSQGKIIRNKTEFIYFIFNKDSDAIKIGKAKNVTKRLQALQTGSPVKLKLLKIIDLKAGKEAQETEKLLHQKFEHLRIIGEWFRYERKLQAFIQEL